jgi:hypothetical protein
MQPEVIWGSAPTRPNPATLPDRNSADNAPDSGIPRLRRRPFRALKPTNVAPSMCLSKTSGLAVVHGRCEQSVIRKLPQEARALKGKALSSLITSTEAFNSSGDDSRATGVLLHLQHSLDMLPRAALVQLGVTVFDHPAQDFRHNHELPDHGEFVEPQDSAGC